MLIYCKQVFIVKPYTSRLANSEKYIVCKYFKGCSDKFIDRIIHEYPKLKTKPFISSILNYNLDYYYINKIEEYNAIFGQQQIENIIKTMTLIERSNFHRDYMLQGKNTNIQKCIQWCLKNNIPYNKNICPRNIFLGNMRFISLSSPSK